MAYHYREEGNDFSRFWAVQLILSMVGMVSTICANQAYLLPFVNMFVVLLPWSVKYVTLLNILGCVAFVSVLMYPFPHIALLSFRHLALLGTSSYLLRHYNARLPDVKNFS